MIDDWRSYRLEDFVPFTPEVYLRLIERVNEAWWPAQLLAIALGLAALGMALRGNTRLGLALLAPAWALNGIVYHLHHYAELNVAATWFGYTFVAQAALLLVLAAIPGKPDPSDRLSCCYRLTGAAIVIAGLLAWPLGSAMHGGAWSLAQVLALHPDPTALVTIGMIVLCLRGLRAGLAAMVPVLWGVISALTLIAMNP